MIKTNIQVKNCNIRVNIDHKYVKTYFTSCELIEETPIT